MTDDTAPPHAPRSLDEVRGAYLDAVLAGSRRTAVRIATAALEEGHDLLEVMRSVLQHTQYEVGDLWEAGRISVAEEHAATAITSFVLADLHGDVPVPPRGAPGAVVSCVEGERHEIGTLMLADALERAGWGVRYLGADTPMESIRRHVAVTRPRLVALSASEPALVSPIAPLVAAIRRDAGEVAPRIVVGGLAFTGFGADWRSTGADATATDVVEAVDAIPEFHAATVA